MATEYADSFGIYDVIQGVNTTLSGISLRRRWNGTGIGNSLYCKPGVGPRGNQCLVLPNGASIAKTHSQQATYITGMNIATGSAVAIGGNPLIRWSNNDQEIVTLQINVDGSVTVFGNGSPLLTTAITFTKNVFAFLELKATLTGTTNINAAVEVRVNGVSLGTASGLTGINAANLTSLTATFNRVFLTSSASSNGFTYIGDYYLLNGSGSTNNDFLGPVTIDPYPLPDGDTSFKNWIPLGGTGANFSEINENPMDGLTSYVQSFTPGAIDSYSWQDVVTFAGTILSVQLTYCAESSAEGDRTFRGNIGLGGTEQQTDTYGLAGDFIYFHQAFDLDPATGLAWTRLGFNAKDFGLELVT